MFEDPKTPTFLSLSASEWHAFGYGLLDGINPFKRRPCPGYSEIDKMDISPEEKADLKEKYHYYRVAFEIPEIVVVIAVIVICGPTAMPSLVAIGAKALLETANGARLT